MKYYSDITKKLYGTPEALKEDEAKVTAAEAEKKAAEAKKKAERAARAKEVEAAFKAEMEAHNKYLELRNQFIKDYGSFHMSYTDVTPSIKGTYDASTSTAAIDLINSLFQF